MEFTKCIKIIEDVMTSNGFVEHFIVSFRCFEKRVAKRDEQIEDVDDFRRQLEQISMFRQLRFAVLEKFQKGDQS